MKKKGFICLLALCGVFSGRLDAQGWDLCVETVGYLTNQVLIPPGHSMLSDPLVRSGGNQFSNLFPQMPVGTRLYKYDSGTGRFSENISGRKGWRKPAETLAPGEGAIIFNPTRHTIDVDFSGYNTASGEIHLRRGLSLVGNRVSAYGSSFIFAQTPWVYCDQPFSVEDGDIVYTFNQTQGRFQKYKYHTATGWDSYPTVGRNESFWIFTRHPRTIGF